METDLFDITQKSHCDIPGLDGRVDNKLEFLGLYGTKSGACKRHHIPALKVNNLVGGFVPHTRVPSILNAIVPGQREFSSPYTLSNVIKDRMKLYLAKDHKSIRITYYIEGRSNNDIAIKPPPSSNSLRVLSLEQFFLCTKSTKLASIL